MRTSRPGKDEGAALLDALAALALIAIALVTAFSAMSGAGRLALNTQAGAVAALREQGERDAAFEALIERGELP